MDARAVKLEEPTVDVPRLARRRRCTTSADAVSSTRSRDSPVCGQGQVQDRQATGVKRCRQRCRQRCIVPKLEGMLVHGKRTRLALKSDAEMTGEGHVCVKGELTEEEEEFESDEEPPSTKLRRGTSEHEGVFWNKAAKKWLAQKRVKGKRVHLGYYADEEDAARAVAEFLERGVVAPPGREGVTSEHTGVSWNKAAKKWRAKKMVQGKQVHLGYYADEEDAARAVAEYVERGVVDLPGRGGVTSEHTGVSWNKAAKKWRAQKKVLGKQVHLGSYTDEEEAARAVAEYVERV